MRSPRAKLSTPKMHGFSGPDMKLKSRGPQTSQNLSTVFNCSMLTDIVKSKTRKTSVEPNALVSADASVEDRKSVTFPLLFLAVIRGTKFISERAHPTVLHASDIDYM